MFAEAEQESWYAAFEKETSSPNSVNVNVADGQFNWSAALRSMLTNTQSLYRPPNRFIKNS